MGLFSRKKKTEFSSHAPVPFNNLHNTGVYLATVNAPPEESSVKKEDVKVEAIFSTIWPEFNSEYPKIVANFGIEGGYGQLEAGKKRIFGSYVSNRDLEIIMYRDPNGYQLSFGVGDRLANCGFKISSIKQGDSDTDFHNSIYPTLCRLDVIRQISTMHAFITTFGDCLIFEITDTEDYSKPMEDEETILGIEVYSPQDSYGGITDTRDLVIGEFKAVPIKESLPDSDEAKKAEEVRLKAVKEKRLTLDSPARYGKFMNYYIRRGTERAQKYTEVHYTRIIHAQEHLERGNYRSANLIRALVDPIVSYRKIIHSIGETAHIHAKPQVVFRSEELSGPVEGKLRDDLNSFDANQSSLVVKTSPQTSAIDVLNVHGKVISPMEYVTAVREYIEQGMGITFKELNSHSMSGGLTSFLTMRFGFLKPVLIRLIEDIFQHTIMKYRDLSKTPDIDLTPDLVKYMNPEELSKSQRDKVMTSVAQMQYTPINLILLASGGRTLDDMYEKYNVPKQYRVTGWLLKSQFDQAVSAQIQLWTEKEKIKLLPQVSETGISSPQTGDKKDSTQDDEKEKKTGNGPLGSPAERGEQPSGTSRSDRKPLAPVPGTNPSAATQPRGGQRGSLPAK